jgi:hypothetical protein
VIVWNELIPVQIRQLREYLGRAEELRRRLLEVNVARVLDDIDQFERVLPDRKREIAGLQQRLEEALRDSSKTDAQAAEKTLDPAIFGAERLGRLPHTLRTELAKLIEGLAEEERKAVEVVQGLEALIQRGPELSEVELLTEMVERVFVQVPMTLTQLSDRILELSLIQARARTESITLMPVKMEDHTALEIARRNRRDWMNARTRLVDAWRLIEFNADDLESDLDIVFSGDIQNVGDNPLKLKASAGRLRVGMQWDGPFTRLLERNVYRESLIDYQQARRSYYQFEDAISAGLRVTIRQIELNQVNFELRRAAVEVAVRQVQLARLRLQEPPRPGETPTFGPTTALFLVDALSALRRAQDAFLSVWVNYEVQRRILDLDLGTMRLDQEGQWIDPGPIGLQFGYPFAEPGNIPHDSPHDAELIPPGLIQ